MSDIYVGGKASRLTYDAKQPRYTGVIINTSDDAYVSAGDIQSTNAHVLEVSCDWATEADAQRILDSISSVEYRPYDASGAIMNPAAELGDGITIGGIYSGIYTQNITFSRLMASEVSAPSEKSIDNEYKYEPKQNRVYKRQFADVRATLQVQADEISAKVSKTGGTEESFSWELESDHFVVKATGNPMLYIDRNGSQFTGVVRANKIETGNITVAGQTIQAGYILGTQIGSSTIGTGNCVQGINTSLGYANFSNDVFSLNTKATYGNFANLSCDNFSASIVSASTHMIANSYRIFGEDKSDAMWTNMSVVTNVETSTDSSTLVNGGWLVWTGGEITNIHFTTEKINYVDSVTVTNKTIYYLGHV